MQVKIDPTTGTLIDEDDDGIYEYFYHENPPPTVEYDLPPLEDPADADFPPDSLIDNPLQPAPPTLEELRDDNALPRASRNEPASQNGTDAAARILNPSNQ
jgi:penicillin-binding protein 1A